MSRASERLALGSQIAASLRHSWRPEPPPSPLAPRPSSLVPRHSSTRPLVHSSARPLSHSPTLPFSHSPLTPSPSAPEGPDSSFIPHPSSFRGPITPTQFTAVADTLIASGSGGLLWRGIAHSPLAETEAGRSLHEAYRLQALEAALHEQEVLRLHRLFREAGVEPLYFKGWTIARLYPERALRPYGDIDCLIRDEQLSLARAALDRFEDPRCGVDLHSGPLYGRATEELFASAQSVQLGNEGLPAVGDADHLRILCIHFLKHGGWRPLSLVDVAVCLESQGPDLDWDRCLHGDPRMADWITCTARLAQTLLGANPRPISTDVATCDRRLASSERPNSELRTKNSELPLPRWLIPAVLRQWGMGWHSSTRGPLSIRLRDLLRHPGRAVSEAAGHWRNPIEASIELNAWFDNKPRWPLQLAATLRHAPRLGHYARPHDPTTPRPNDLST